MQNGRSAAQAWMMAGNGGALPSGAIYFPKIQQLASLPKWAQIQKNVGEAWASIVTASQIHT